MTVAAGQDLADETAATLAALMVGAAAKLAAIAVKPSPLASSPQLAMTTPTRVLMTFIAQPFRLSARMNRELVLVLRGRR